MIRPIVAAAAGVLTTLAMVAIVPSSAASPEAGAPGTPLTPKVIAVDGATNVRDLGGYITPEGKMVRYGMVYRSANLSAVTDSGIQELAALDLGDVVDLRGPNEVAYFGADKVPAGVPVISEPEVMPAPTTPAIATADYKQLIDDPSIRQSTANTLLTIAQNAGKPLLFNCSGGVDRAGWVSAVLLTILGLSSGPVNEDYLYSNTVLGANIANAQYLQTAFSEATTDFGSFDNYVHTGLGISDSTIATLRALLLA